MKRSTLTSLLIAIVGLVVALSACRAPECQQMLECCAEVEELDGVGGACHDIAEDTRDPQTCRDVVRTIGYMLEDRDASMPEPCRQ